ncbi:MAG: TonB C-terminal domain-containing protein, partial [Candidatus Omnitrophica bacterium]|nr:TonB C-terminal domain-containing protein [Candidatus Omnitrophota bacterium]
VPIVQTSQAETTVMVKDGTTIVIAGLIENREEEEVKSVPGVGNVPVVGNLFKSRTKGSTTNPEKNELVIFLTPHIISGDVSSPDVEKYGNLTGKLEKQLTQKEIKEVSKPKPEEKKGRGEEEAVGKEALPTKEKDEEIILPKKEPQQEISINEYYEMVRKKIFEKIRENYPGQDARGEVAVSFCITRDGRLKGEPRLLKPTHECLKEATIKGIHASAPFPPFPTGGTNTEETLKITVIYE